MSGDIVLFVINGRWWGLLLASSRWRPGVLLTSYVPRSAPSTKIYPVLLTKQNATEYIFKILLALFNSS